MLLEMKTGPINIHKKEMTISNQVKEAKVNEVYDNR